VDLICTHGTPATLAAKQATESIPIVFGETAFPERTGLVSSLARPGGNVTGATFLASVYGQRLALLREVMPRLSRVALLYNDNNPAGVLAVNETQQWAQSLRVIVEPLDVQSGASLATALVAMSRHRPDALMTTTDPVFLLHRKAILEFAARHRLAAIYGYRAYVGGGGLMFYGHRTKDIWRHAATYVDRILKGAKAGELPVEQSAQFELAINLKTAEALGVTIPLSVLLRAAEVIE
jgi:putative ABC transport system substrate-binding protein